MLQFMRKILFLFYFLSFVPEYTLQTNEEEEMKLILGDNVISEQCTVTCDPNAKYRTIDGTCNNLKHPCWGKANRGYSSFLPPQFADGIGCPRKAKSGTNTLPIPRTVSIDVHPDLDIKSPRLSQLTLGYGQAIAIEFSAAMDGVKNDTKYSCADVANSKCKGLIEIPADDPYLPSPSCTFILPNIHIRCNGTGSICGCDKCKPGQVEYVNGATAFLDASTVYGSSESVQNDVREPNSAKLRSSQGNLLSRSTTQTCANNITNCSSMCFNTGTEVPGNGDVLILSMFTMWMREHNRLVEKFSSMWLDQETLFQEVRKIIGAMMQHVFYAEFLPLMLGNCGHPSLKTPTPHHLLKYDPDLDPTVVSECYVGACRLGHTLLNSIAHLYNSRETWNVGEAKNVQLFCRGSKAVDDIIGGMFQQHAMARDTFIQHDVTNNLHFPGHSLTDLIAIDIQRGRQRGVPGYLDLLRYCGYEVPKKFSDLKKYFPVSVVNKYRKLYGNDGMENIDLNSAMLAERPLENCTGIWGPVTTCIVSETFRRLKTGDRFWYERLNEPQSFTNMQVMQIQRTTMARLVCSNTNIKQIQRKAFEFTRPGNDPVSCEEIIREGDINESMWMWD